MELFGIKLEWPGKDRLNGLCNSCNALCCRAGITIYLETQGTAQDLKAEVAANHNLTTGEVSVVEAPGNNRQIFLVTLLSDCGHLKGNVCGNYADRPDYCRTYEAGNVDCLTLRAVKRIEG